MLPAQRITMPQPTMTKTARRKQRKAHRATRNFVPRATPASALPINPFDLTPADIQRAAESIKRNAQRSTAKGQRKASIIGGNKRPQTDQTDHSSSVRHAPPARDPGRCDPVAADVLYFEAWRDFISANKAQYKPRHFLGIWPIWRWNAQELYHAPETKQRKLQRGSTQ